MKLIFFLMMLFRLFRKLLIWIVKLLIKVKVVNFFWVLGKINLFNFVSCLLVMFLMMIGVVVVFYFLMMIFFVIFFVLYIILGKSVLKKGIFNFCKDLIMGLIGVEELVVISNIRILFFFREKCWIF